MPTSTADDAGLEPADAALPSDLASVGADQGNDAFDLARSDSAMSVDLAMPVDLAMSVDLAAPPDLTPLRDLTTPADLTALPDLAFPANQDVNIYVDNTCKMDVEPKVINVPRGTTLKLSYHNRSLYYPVDVWLSYGGGFTDLGTGMTWADRFEHCSFPRPYSSYADISTACSNYRLMINCL